MFISGGGGGDERERERERETGGGGGAEEETGGPFSSSTHSRNSTDPHLPPSPVCHNVSHHIHACSVTA